eukprot:3715582-Pyramimonas_sp.AAC.1
MTAVSAAPVTWGKARRNFSSLRNLPAFSSEYAQPRGTMCQNGYGGRGPASMEGATLYRWRVQPYSETKVEPYNETPRGN